ncbi:MAG: translocation/assembly module TamB domain-containing protein [Pseudomonadota bacterium]
MAGSIWTKSYDMSGLKRWCLIALACFVLLFTLLPIVLVWFVGSEVVLQRVANSLTESSDGIVKAEGVQGSLYGPIKIQRLLFETEKQRIEANDVELDWSPKELFDRLIHIRHLNIASLHVQQKLISNEKSKLPKTLRLPFAMRIDEARLSTLSIANLDGAPVQLKDIAANIDTRNETYIVDLKSIDTPWASGNAHLELGIDTPFPLKVDSHVIGRAPRGFTLNLIAGGSLQAIRLSANGATQGGKATLDAVVTPFDDTPIQTFTLDATDVDLHDLDNALPFTKLALDAKGDIGEKNTVNAHVIAINLVPGTIDEQRLPLKTLRGQLNGTVEQFTAHDLAIDLGAGGKFNGEASMKNGQAQIKLTTGNLNLQGLHGALRPTHAAGTLALTAAGKDFSEQRLQANLNETKLQMRLRLDAARHGDELRIAAADLTAASGMVTARGQLNLAGKKPFELTGKLVHFNPAAFGKFPVADIGADIRAAGQLTPTQADIAFTLANSTLRGQPISGQGKINVAESRIVQADVSLDLAGNRLDAKGAFGHLGDELAWQLNAVDLARIDPSLAGHAQGKGVLRGTLDDPAGTLTLTAGALRMPGSLAITTLEARGNIASGKNGAIDAHLTANGVKKGNTELALAKVDVTGTRGRHILQMVAQGKPGINTAKPDIDMTSELNGGWDSQRGWSGQITSLVNRGRYAVQLRVPAPLIVGGGRFELGATSLALADGRIDVATIKSSPGKLVTSGTISGLSLAYLQTLFPAQTRADDVKATLTLGGRWSLEMGESINGNIQLAREAGDLTLISEPKLPLGLTQLNFVADIVRNRVKATFDLQGKTTGVVGVRIDTQLAQRDGAWGVPGDAPLSIVANGDIPSLAWTGIFLNPGYAVDGRARLRFTRTGPARAPQVSGSLEGDDLTLRIADYGVNLRNGILRANFEANRVVLSQFRMRADQGELTADGSLTLGQTDASIVEGGADIRASQLSILNTPDYRLTVTGNGKLAFTGGKLAVTGDVRADHGAIRLADNNRPTLSDDVIVVGKPDSKTQKSGATPLSINLLLDLGDDFTLRGHGLDASLRGNLRLKSAPPGLPVGNGTIRVAKGTYEAYGETLEIDRGVISFAGPIDNPTLDILAARKNLAVEPGVAISGSALNPRVKLVSEPNVPDTEKLAWLVLGHGLEGSTGAEMDLLPVAAAALLSSQGHTPTKGIAQTFGLDEIGLSRNTSTATSNASNGVTPAEQHVLTVGKRISSKLYLTYETGLDIASRVVGLQYEFSRRWSVRAETGTRSAVDLFYTLRFE